MTPQDRELARIVQRMEADGLPEETIRAFVAKHRDSSVQRPPTPVSPEEKAAANPPGFVQRFAEGMGVPTSLNEAGEALKSGLSVGGGSLPFQMAKRAAEMARGRGAPEGAGLIEKTARLAATGSGLPLEKISENTGTDVGTGNLRGLAGDVAAGAVQVAPFTKPGQAAGRAVGRAAQAVVGPAASRGAQFLARYGVRPKISPEMAAQSARSGQSVPAIRSFLAEEGVNNLPSALKARQQIGQAIGEQLQQFEQARNAPAGAGAMPEQSAVISKEALRQEIQRTASQIARTTGSPESAARVQTVLNNLIESAPEQMTPAEAHRIKTHLAERTNFGSDAALQGGRARLVKSLSQMIGDAVPEVRPLAGRYADLTQTVDSLARMEPALGKELTLPAKVAAARRTARILHRIGGGRVNRAPQLRGAGGEIPVASAGEEAPFYVEDAKEPAARPHMEEGVPQESQRTSPQRELELGGQAHGGELGAGAEPGGGPPRRGGPPAGPEGGGGAGGGFNEQISQKTGTFGLKGPLGEKVGGRVLPDRIEMTSIGKGGATSSQSAVQALRDFAKRQGKPVYFTSTNLSTTGGAFRARMIARGELIPVEGGYLLSGTEAR